MSLNNLRVAALYLGVLALTLALFFTRSQGIGWAAPGQSPDQQTVAPRTPTPTPSPVPTPTTTPAPVPTRGPAEDDDRPAAPTPTGIPNDRPAGAQTPESPLPPEPGDGAEGSEKPGPAASPQAGSAPDISASPTPAAPADLSLSKTVTGENSLQVMEAVTFTVVVTNSGPGPARNVEVKDLLPAALIFEMAHPSQGDYHLETGLWQAGTLFPGQSISLTIRARVINMGTVTNTAEILAADQPDPDSTPGNGLTGEDDLANVVVSALPGSSPAVEAEKDDRLISAHTVPALSSPIAGDQGSLYWLYAPIFGLLLALLGLFLINKAR